MNIRDGGSIVLNAGVGTILTTSRIDHIHPVSAEAQFEMALNSLARLKNDLEEIIKQLRTLRAEYLAEQVIDQ